MDDLFAILRSFYRELLQERKNLSLIFKETFAQVDYVLHLPDPKSCSKKP